MNQSVAIVGIACRYPDAASPHELWQNVLSQRRAFRRIPPERLNLDDYYSEDKEAPDRIYQSEAALIEGYEFDRVRFRVAGSTFRATDLTHWLALDMASQALADAGFANGEGLPHHTTGVIVGNTLTGEFSRAHVMRLRWPYVRRVVETSLLEEGWPAEQRHAFLANLEAQYKSPFPAIGEDTLAGGLANTIAGRICNYFDLKGGGYIVDGACASSLLAVKTACAALSNQEMDVALAGGVDLSIDPFELVGFAKTGALTPGDMRIYDKRSAGFLPGEGCGMVVLMRYEDAVAQNRLIYAVIRGWGVSSDGSGGMTRPEVEGQTLALQRAYARSGFGIETVSYIEGHGTGTAVGDAVELQTLSRARQAADPTAPPALIGSIKANIGHTKAAAGIAGLIKATMALHTQILPPTTGTIEPHVELTGQTNQSQHAPALRVSQKAEAWPADLPLRASVSAMGFGGINAHIVLEGVSPSLTPPNISSSKMARGETLCSPSIEGRGVRGGLLAEYACTQDPELILLAAKDTSHLLQQVEHLLTFAAQLSRAEVGDFAAQLASTLPMSHNRAAKIARAAIVASNAKELERRLERLRSWLLNGSTAQQSTHVFLGIGESTPQIAFVFPGQGAPAHLDGGALRRRFEFVEDLYLRANLPTEGRGVLTSVAQPAIVSHSMAALRVLAELGIEAQVAVGHSLGELSALHWGGAFDEQTLLCIATVRGQIMANLGGPTGAMASLAAGAYETRALLNGASVSIACLNSPRHTVISGEARAVDAVVAKARLQGTKAKKLAVSHAFHSPLVAPAVPSFGDPLSRIEFAPLRQSKRRVFSTVTGALLDPNEDLRQLLYRQITDPVRFTEAISAAADGIDLMIEVGPGQTLHGLVAQMVDMPIVSLNAGGGSLKGLLQAVGAAFALGAPVNHQALFKGRFTKPFDLNWQPKFFANPCELAPSPPLTPRPPLTPPNTRGGTLNSAPIPSILAPSSVPPLVLGGVRGGLVAETTLVSPSAPATASPLELMRELVAARAELPPAAVRDEDRLLSDLHLNSIVVSQLMTEAARHLGLSPLISPTEYADASIAEAAQALEELEDIGEVGAEDSTQPLGIDAWVRAFTVELVQRAPAPARFAEDVDMRDWNVIAPPNHALASTLQSMLEASDETVPPLVLGGVRGGLVIVCLPPEPNERHLSLLLEGARLAQRENERFVLVQHGGGAAAFARTLHLERPKVTTCVIDVPLEHPKAAEWVLAEARAGIVATGYSEVHYDALGTRREPVLRVRPLSHEKNNQAKAAKEALLLGPDDVLLVSGGGKGITAECAFSLAIKTGVRLALMGRSQPEEDADLSANLKRMVAAGIKVRYLSADVTDEKAVQAAVRTVEAELGPITAILHGAARNAPQLISSLDEETFRQTVAPKVQGARHLLAAVNRKQLRLFIAFGSIIARTGLAGEADYGVANEWLARLTEQLQQEQPTCRCLAIEWSVWGSVGMGARLSQLDALARQGILPITVDDGVRMLHRLLANRAQPDAPVATVVTSRFGSPPTLNVEEAELPFSRFIEQVRVYYPGVELIVDTTLSNDTDPYLADHVFRGEPIFPAVMAFEAMAQVAMALAEQSTPPTIFKNARFQRPIVVPVGESVTIRIAALINKAGQIEIALRSEATGFQVDHFRATCCFEQHVLPHSSKETRQRPEGEGFPAIQIDPTRHLYGKQFFHKGRFQRVADYRQLTAKECVAELAPNRKNPWFGPYLPHSLVLADPGARDAAIHAIQVCVPHQLLLPSGVEELHINPIGSAPRFVHARQRERKGDLFIYDVEVSDAEGQLLERWQGLHLQIVSGAALEQVNIAPLLGPYMQRRLEKLLPNSTATIVVTQNQTAERRTRSNIAIQRALRKNVKIWRRPDGKPEVAAISSGYPPVKLNHAISVAHAGHLTLAVAGKGPLGCDIEPITERSASVWHSLLGKERYTLAQLIANKANEEIATAATRVWAANECLKKAGTAIHAPLLLKRITADGWVLFSSNLLVTATCVAQVPEIESPLILAVLMKI